MMGIKQNIAKSFFKLEVNSDIPGRLRLQIGNYSHIPKDIAESYFPMAQRVLSKMPDVASVELGKHTGSMLIIYDKEKTNSAHIIGQVNVMIEIGFMLYDKEKSLKEKSLEEIETLYLQLLEAHKTAKIRLQ